MADPFGLDDFSMLSGPQQNTARTVQKAFDASLAGRQRGLERFNLGTYGPMFQSFANESALRRAQTTAGLLNNNQQLQNLIDESHRTPHGFMENFQAYGGALGNLAKLYPALFGTNTDLGKNGLIPTAWGGLQKGWGALTNAIGQVKGPNGLTYSYDSNGNIVGYNQGGTEYWEPNMSGWNQMDFNAPVNWTAPMAEQINWGDSYMGADFDPNAFASWWT